MKAIPPVKAVMTPFPFWVDIDEPLDCARETMREKAIHHLPVVEAGRLVGVLGLRDVEPEAARVDTPRVRDAFRPRTAYVVGLAEPLDRVLLHLADSGLDAALVARDGKLVGIFTASDACREFGKLLRSLFPHGGDDAA